MRRPASSSALKSIGWLAAAALMVLAGSAAAQSAGWISARKQPEPGARPFDIVIRGGRVMDGSGNPWFYADVGIRGDRIAAVGRLGDAAARRVIDARGRLVVPGFIDLHTHADGPNRNSGLRSEDARRRAAPAMVVQGVTTVVVNQDGRSPLPIGEQRRMMEELGTGPNAILLVGHGSVRSAVMERDYRRPATVDEIAGMRALVRQAMEEGAWGLSTGLEYVPGRWSTTDEVVALVEEIVPYGGVYISHERSEGSDPMWYWPSRDEPGPPTLLDAVMETIEIGERTGATVVASHIKAKGAHYWGSSYAAIQLIQAARDRGVAVWADQYPYATSGSDGNTVLIPGWVFRAGVDERALAGMSEEEARRAMARVDFRTRLRAVLADERLSADLRKDIAHEIRRRGGAGRVVVFDYPDSTYVGRTLGELATMRGLSEVEMAIALQMEGYADRRGGARLRGFSMSELDLDAYARQPWTATASDAGVALPDDGPVHARFYGTFPRKVRYFALERGVITLEHAVRAGTSLPAQILGLRDRGMIREGFGADIAVLDLENYGDRATFFEPHQYAEGVEYVLVNGRFVVEEGVLTWALPGRVLTP